MVVHDDIYFSREFYFGLDIAVEKLNRTDADTLEKLRGQHEIIGLILEYRKVTKLRSTYVEGLLKVVGKDGI